MNSEDFETVTAAFDEIGLWYVIVGGLAVAVHGYLRFAPTLDLMIPATTEARDSASRALDESGYRARAGNPVEDGTKGAFDRQQPGVEEIITLTGHSGSDFPINLVLTDTARFEREHERARRVEICNGRVIPFLSIESLIRKTVVVGARPDADDLEHLRWLAEDRESQTQVSTDPWETATWEGSRRAQLRRWAALSLERILDAQEQMRDLGERFGSSPAPCEAEGLLNNDSDRSV